MGDMKFKKDATRIMKRYEGNPILHVDDFPGIGQIYNPSVVKYKDEFIMLVSVVDYAAEGGGTDVGQTRIARSKDGIHFELSDENFIKVPDVEPFNLTKHYIDNRITKIDDTYYIVTPVMMKGDYLAPVGMLGKTTDFKDYEAMAIITAPRNRGCSIFPEKINGMYYKLDRPYDYPSSCSGEIWISESPDLIHWGNYRPVLKQGYNFWNTVKIGPTPAIKTEKGWLEIVHGVANTAGGTYYYIGAILLDLNEPWKVIGKTSSYLMMPEKDYELHGNSDNTVFPCCPYADFETDTLYLYYGAADRAIGLATGSISQIVEACIEGI